MNILIVIGAFLPVPPTQGGAVEKLWFAIAKDLVKHNHGVTIISKQVSNFLDREVDINGIQHIRVKGYDTPRNLGVLKLLDLLYTLNTLIHINDEYDVIISNTFWLPFLLHGKKGCKVVVDVERMPRWQVKFYTHVGLIRANSTPVSEKLRQLIPSQFHEKVVQIPNPLPHRVSEINWKKKINGILYVGRIHREKGVELLVNAFCRSKKLSDWSLSIVGPHEIKDGGSGTAYLNELMHISQEFENVQFLGPIYETDLLQELYAQNSIFVYPSLAEQGETFGLAPLEAMSFGCVPIVSDLPCFHDFIKHGKNGYIFDHRGNDNVHQLRSLLEEVCISMDQSVCVRERAIEVNKSHSTEVITQQFLEYFEDLQTIRTN